jgi:hypothetical protein
LKDGLPEVNEVNEVNEPGREGMHLRNRRRGRICRIEIRVPGCSRGPRSPRCRTLKSVSASMRQYVRRRT